MALFIASLNSGSNGNCYYIGNHNEAILIDAGISCRETEKRMKRIGLSMNKVKAVFISHEHDDHIKGIESLLKKYSLPVYITEETLQNTKLSIKKELLSYFRSNERIRIGGITIKAFTKKHDACDPHSFIVSDDNNICIGIFTDIGKACEQVTYHFRQCNAVFLEANYDDAMLAAGSYPYFLKNRISGGSGHLSNAAALDLFCMHRSKKLTHLILSHLSENNNNPEIVQQLFMQHAGNTKIIVADRYRETEVFFIHQNVSSTPAEKNIYVKTSTQLTMF
jgi:phosphoribosyl 1,2-cyclic phosphodiesterase